MPVFFCYDFLKPISSTYAQTKARHMHAHIVYIKTINLFNAHVRREVVTKVGT